VNIRGQYVCSGVIVHSNPSIVIDTYAGSIDTPSLLQNLQPDIVIASHFHVDHSAFMPIAAAYTNAEIFVPSGEEIYLTNIENYLNQLAPDDKNMQLLWQKKLIGYGYKELDNYRSYDDKTDFGFRDRNFMKVIRSPGHSPAHNSFYFPRDKILFPGDIGLDKVGPWYGFSNCSLVEHISSILRLMELDIDLVITCHNGIILKEDSKPSLKRCLKVIYDRETLISRKLDKGYDRSRIVEEGILFGGKTDLAEPMRSRNYCADDIVFLFHYELIQKGGMIEYFPAVRETFLGA